MNGILKRRVINTNKRHCPKPAEETVVAKTETITPVEITPKKKQNIKPQSGKSND